MSKYYHPGFLLFSLHFPSHICLWDFASLTWKASGQNQVMFVETVSDLCPCTTTTPFVSKSYEENCIQHFPQKSELDKN